jgi:iron(III) transport system permease protein
MAKDDQSGILLRIVESGVSQKIRRALRWDSSTFLIVLGVVIVLWLLVVPVVMLVMSSLRTGPPSMPGPWTLRNYGVAFSSEFFLGSLVNTFIISTGATLGALGLAILFAWLIERTDMPFRGAAWVAVLLPLVMPGVLFALAWMLLLLPKFGLINIVARDLLGIFGVALEEGPLDIQSLWGLVYLGTLRGVSTIFLMIVGLFRTMDPGLEESARISGAPPWRVFRKITLPLLGPALFAAGTYSFVSHLDSFEAPLAVGLPAGIFVLATLIYFQAILSVPGDYGLSAAYAVFFMAIMAVFAGFYLKIISRSDRFAVIRGRGFQPSRYRLGKWRYVAFGLFVSYFVLTVAAPMLVLMWASLLPFYMVPSAEAFAALSLNQYSTVLNDPRFVSDLVNTLYMAVGAASATMAVALLLSWIVVRTKSRARFALDGFTFISFAVPGVVVALALVFVYLRPPFRYLGIYGTTWMIILGLITQYLAFATRTTNGGLIQIHQELEEAASTSGAGRLTTLWRITVPLLIPCLVAGWIWVVAHSLRAFSIPLILGTKRNEVLSVWIWIHWQNGHIPLAAALGVILIIITAVLAIAARHLVTRTAMEAR